MSDTAATVTMSSSSNEAPAKTACRMGPSGSIPNGLETDG